MRTAKRIILIALVFCFWQSILRAQTVDNIEAIAVGGQIQVSCRLQASTPVDLSLSWSDDGGLSFNPCLTVSGDLLYQLSGTKVINWDCGKDGIIMGSFIFKITSLPAASPQAATQVNEPEEQENLHRVEEDIQIEENLPATPPRTADTIPGQDAQNVIPDSKPPPNKSHFLLMAGVTAGDPISYSLSVGFLTGKWGGYAKVKSNFAFKGDARTGGPNDAFYVDGFSKKGRFSVSAGVTVQVADILLIYAGIGYGSRWVQWKTSSGQLITIAPQSFSAIDPELGLTLKTGNFLIGAGVSALLGTQTVIETNLSIGLIF